MFATRTFQASVLGSQSTRPVLKAESRISTRQPEDVADWETLEQRCYHPISIRAWQNLVANRSRIERLRFVWARAIDREMEFRAECLSKRDGDLVHHFNWEGRAVEAASTTPPEVSLLVIMSWPKVPQPYSNSELRWSVLIESAMKWIDPVVVDWKDDSDIPLSSNALLKFAMGRTFKYYTRHGSWSYNAAERNNVVLDSADPEAYDVDVLGIGNGFIEGTPIQSRHKWYLNEKALRDEARDEAKRKTRPRRKACKKPSSLKNCVSVTDLESV